MKPLPDHFIGRGAYRGFIFAKIQTSDLAFLYEVNVSGALYYHVFRRRENKRFGNVRYPTPNAFGMWALCFYKDYDKAKMKFDELNNSEKNER